MAPQKRLVVCCDGTWVNSNQGLQGADADADPIEPMLQQPSNVTRIARCIARSDPPGASPSVQQIVYYQSGIGTRDLLDKVVGGATGLGLSENIREAYQFLASNYEPDDEIFLIGFSRGSFTARSIAAFINEVGLITPKGMPYFYPIFEDWENQLKPGYKTHFPDWPFKEAKGPRPSLGDPSTSKLYLQRLVELKFAIPNVRIKAVAVYDTVGSLGLPKLGIFTDEKATRSIDYAFVDTTVPECVDHAIHALALDETRRPFTPTIWELPNPQKGQDLIQCWFSGSHADVGGSWNDDCRNADITLAWMVQQLSEYLAFDYAVLKEQYYQPQGIMPVGRRPKDNNERPYACGTIHDAMTALYELGGLGRRTPDGYNFYDHMTGREKKPLQPLVNTCEMIHPTVRLRLGLPGKGLWDKGQYDAVALHGWTCHGTRASSQSASGPLDLQQIQEGQKAIHWDNTTQPGKRMPEALLGPIEYDLMCSIQPSIRDRFLSIAPL